MVPRPAPRMWVGQRSICPSGWDRRGSVLGPPLPAPTSPCSVSSPCGLITQSRHSVTKQKAGILGAMGTIWFTFHSSEV